MMEKELSNSEEIKEKLIRLKEKISILEWDDKRMQINPYKKAQLGEMRKEYDELKESVGENSDKEVIPKV